MFLFSVKHILVLDHINAISGKNAFWLHLWKIYFKSSAVVELLILLKKTTFIVVVLA